MYDIPYRSTSTRTAIIRRLLKDDEIKSIFINNGYKSLMEAINYIEYLGETRWNIVDHGTVLRAINYQPCFTETTVVEFWR